MESRRQKAFTLIELLVVIAIIALLVTILAPSLRQVEDILKCVVCRSNMRQLAIAWNTYSYKNDQMLMGSNTGRSFDWTGTWGNMKAGVLYPYIETPKPYKCTNPINPGYPVSYSISGTLNGEDARWKTTTAIPRPSEVMVFIEEDDWRGYNVNSFLLTSQNQWTDYVAGNHDDGDNLAFGDGHASYWKWVEYNTLAFPHQDAPFYKPDPGNWDLKRLWEVWACVDVLH